MTDPQRAAKALPGMRERFAITPLDDPLAFFFQGFSMVYQKSDDKHEKGLDPETCFRHITTIQGGSGHLERVPG